MGSLVSIIIPCYNSEKYIIECLDSIVTQTYSELEIICVDDGSEDNTVSIIEGYISRDNRIRLLKQNHLYAGVARNTGIKIATGKYVMFLDSDDYFDATLIEKMVNSAEENESDTVICDAYYVNNVTGEITSPDYLLNKKVVDRYKVYSRKELPNNVVRTTCSGPWTKLYRLDFIRNNNLEYRPTKRNNDIFFTYLAMVLAERISVVNQRLIYYRFENEESLQGSMNKKSFSRDFQDAFSSIKKELEKRKLFDLLKVEYYNMLVPFCEGVLNKQKDYNLYEEAFDYIREIVFHDLELETNLSILEYANVIIAKNIMQMNCKEYLHFRWKYHGSYIYELGYIQPELLMGSKRIAIYGAGKIGKATYTYLSDLDEYDIVGWFDSNYEKIKASGLKVSPINDIADTEFDKIVIAIYDAEISSKVRNMLLELGVNEEKIISHYLCN